VIVPELGGFVLQSCPATYTAAMHAFYPFHKEIVFNPALNHNDGLLSESYMQTYGMDYKEALAALKKDIANLKTALEQQGTVSLGIIGTLTKNKTGACLFFPGKDTSLYSIHSYGLETIYVSPVPKTERLQQARQETPDKTERTVYLPLSRTFVYITGLVAAAITLFFLISTPVNEVNKAHYTASLIPPEIMLKSANAPAHLPSPPQEEASVATPETEHAAVSDTTPAPIPEIIPEQPKTEGKTYYVIIGSFYTEKQANRYIKEIDPSSDFEHIGIVKRNENVRVYANKYTNRQDAEDYMYHLRKNTKFKDAWLFISR